MYIYIHVFICNSLTSSIYLSRLYEMKKKPAFILNFILKPGGVDINVSPDKREVLLTDEVNVLEILKQGLQVLWEPARYVYIYTYCFFTFN